MKKILAVLVVLVLLGLGATYFLGGGVQKEVENFILQNNEFQIKKSEFNRGFGKSSGAVDGVIKKEQIHAKFGEILKNAILGKEDEKLKEIEKKVKEIFKDDFEFRYDYEVNHSVLGVANGFEIDGKVSILTPGYAKISNEIFKTATPLEINSKVGIQGSEISSKLADIMTDAIAVKGISLLSNLTNQNEVKNAEFVVDEFELKLDEFAKEQGAKDVKFVINNINYKIKFDTPVKAENLTNSIFAIGNYDYDIGANNLAMTTSEGNLFALKEMSSVGRSEISNEFANFADKSKIDSAEFYGLVLKNLSSDLTMQIDKNFIEYIVKNGANFKELEDEELKKIIAQILQKGVKITLNNLSLENTKSDKIALKSDFGISDFSSEDKILDSIKFDGKLTSSTSATNFLGAYEHLALLALIAEPALKEYAKPQGDGFFIDFSYDNKTKEFVVGDKRFSASEFSDKDDDKIVSLTSANILAIRSDLMAYHLSQGGFAESMDKMTNVKFESIAPNSVHLLSANKKCIKVSFFAKTTEKDAFIKFEKGSDESHRICQKIYENSDVKEQLENSELIAF